MLITCYNGAQTVDHVRMIVVKKNLQECGSGKKNISTISVLWLTITKTRWECIINIAFFLYSQSINTPASFWCSMGSRFASRLLRKRRIVQVIQTHTGLTIYNGLKMMPVYCCFEGSAMPLPVTPVMLPHAELLHNLYTLRSRAVLYVQFCIGRSTAC